MKAAIWLVNLRVQDPAISKVISCQYHVIEQSNARFGIYLEDSSWSNTTGSATAKSTSATTATSTFYAIPGGASMATESRSSYAAISYFHTSSCLKGF
jgi:hypothetical protein